jgi:flagellar hook protein FlgE
MSFEQGLSGLNAASTNLNAIGNNVANASTVGFKQSSAQFADMYAASLSGATAAQIGTGVSVATVAQQFTQGNITSTTNPLDTAINGPGFFQLTDTAGATIYSRNGQFQLDKNGFMVNAQGSKVNGYMPNAAGVILSGAPVPLQINPANLPPQPTATSTVGVNLNSAAAVPITAVFNSTDPTSYSNSTSMTVYDSLGASHVGTMYFDRLPLWAAGTTPAAPGVVGVPTTTSASLTSVAGLSAGNTLTFTPALPALPQTVTITGVNSLANSVTFAALAVAPVTPTVVSTNAPSANWNTYFTVDGAMIPAVSTTAPATVAGATGATLTSAAGLAVGSNITIAGNPGALTLTAVNLLTGAVSWAPATTVATAAGAAVTGQTPLSTLSFSSLGALISTNPPTTPLGTVTSAALFPNSTSVSTNQTIAFNFASPTAATTQYGGAFGINTLTQNGYASGQLNSTSTSADGTIMGRYSNGQTRSLGQLVLANFTGVQGLQSIGNNAWVQTAASGNPLVGTPGSGSLGALQSSSTEDSNVDLTAALVNMITAQRVYQANAQTIKTEDQLMQTVVNLR